MKEFYVPSKDVSVSGNGKYPGARSVEELVKNGVIILDKWQGVTSREAVEVVKKIIGIKKAGHSGTLDPMVSGVLPVALENSCKIMPALQGLDKEYVGVMKLHKDVDEKKVADTMKKFVGVVKQVPPVRSAVARRERERKIYSFSLLEKQGRDVLFRISCEAGTYVRVVCHALGKKLGVGAHMDELRRTRAGRFDESFLVDIHDLEAAFEDFKSGKNENIRNFIMPMEAAAEHIKTIIVKDSAIRSLVNGSPLFSAGVSLVEKTIQKDDIVVLMSHKGELVALGYALMNAKEMTKRRGAAAKVSRVVIEKGIYP